MKTPPIVSPQEWEAARQELLVKEKELTRARDALAAERRRMPWLAVDKAYQFDGPDGMASLLDLFDGRRQLIVYRAFYGPEVTTYAEGGTYPERACVGCSFVADQVADPAHLNARNTTLAFASRAPQAEIQGLKQRHRWEHIPWYTITDDFDRDFDVDQWHGTNAFLHEAQRFPGFADTEEVTGSNPVAPTRHNVSLDPPLRAACQQIVSRSLSVTAVTLSALTPSGGFRRSSAVRFRRHLIGTSRCATLTAGSPGDVLGGRLGSQGRRGVVLHHGDVAARPSGPPNR
jgi:predicted dithiol-disulfide oxidoreductase (DUF899 family)